MNNFHANPFYDILIDKSSTGRINPWADKKRKSILVAESFQRLGEIKKAVNISCCGNILEFLVFPDDKKKLYNANFCKARLCPMCAWRRSLKVYGQLERVMEVALKEDKYEFLFLTLTIRNCDEGSLSSTIDQLMKGYFNLMHKKKEIKGVVKGSFRALEVTYNSNSNSNAYDTFHPHFHCILMVNKSYFHDTDVYISQRKFIELWRESLNIDYDPVLDIRKIGDSSCNLKKAVAETAKYSVKDADLLHEDQNMMDKVIFTLDNALAGRRLISFSGRFKEIFKALKLDDAIDGDLIRVGDEVLHEDDAIGRVRYAFNHEWYDYYRINECFEYVRLKQA